MKQIVGSSLARGKTTNRPEPESFDDIIPEQPPVGYEHWTVWTGIAVEATTKLLRPLRLFFGKQFRKRRDGPSVSLAGQCTHTPASHGGNV